MRKSDVERVNCEERSDRIQFTIRHTWISERSNFDISLVFIQALKQNIRPNNQNNSSVCQWVVMEIGNSLIARLKEFDQIRVFLADLAFIP